MKNDSKIIEQLPHVIVSQWNEAQAEGNPASWHYVAGMIAMEITRNPCPELMDLHNLAIQNAKAAGSLATSAYASLTPAQRKMELIDVLARMKSHSITLSQFFSRLKTKRDAMEAMEREIENFQELVALVRLDVMREIEEMEVQS